MQGIGTDLDQLHADRVRELWKILQEECGSRSIRMTPVPHFTWQIAEHYETERVKDILLEITSHLPPFRVFTTGLGLFTGTFPVIYIPVIKNAAMIALHEMLWERTKPIRSGASDYYSPLLWTPHITLSYDDENSERTTCALKRIATMSFNWELPVDNLSFAVQSTEGGEWAYTRFDFQGTP